MNAQNAGSTVHDGEGEFEKSDQGREDKNDNAAKWKILKNNVLESKEAGQASADFEGAGEKKQDKLGQWVRAVGESPISSLESLTPGQSDPLQHQGGLLSFLRSQGSLNSAPASTNKVGLNDGGNMEKDISSGEHELIYHIH